MGNKFKQNKNGVSTNQQGETLTREKEKKFLQVIAELKGELKKTDIQLRQSFLDWEQGVAKEHDIVSKSCWAWERWPEYWVIYQYVSCLTQLEIASSAELCSEHLEIDEDMVELSWRQLMLDGLLREDIDNKTGEIYQTLRFPFYFVDENKTTREWEPVLNAQIRQFKNGTKKLSIEKDLKEIIQ